MIHREHNAGAWAAELTQECFAASLFSTMGKNQIRTQNLDARRLCCHHTTSGAVLAQEMIPAQPSWYLQIVAYGLVEVLDTSREAYAPSSTSHALFARSFSLWAAFVAVATFFFGTNHPLTVSCDLGVWILYTRCVAQREGSQLFCSITYPTCFSLLMVDLSSSRVVAPIPTLPFLSCTKYFVRSMIYIYFEVLYIA